MNKMECAINFKLKRERELKRLRQSREASKRKEAVIRLQNSCSENTLKGER